MVTVHICSKLKTSWKLVVFTNKVGKNSWYFVGVFNKIIIPLVLVGYEMIIANSALHPLLAIYHLISNTHLWNNCEIYSETSPLGQLYSRDSFIQDTQTLFPEKHPHNLCICYRYWRDTSIQSRGCPLNRGSTVHNRNDKTMKLITWSTLNFINIVCYLF